MNDDVTPVAWLAVNAMGHRYLRFKRPEVAVDPAPLPLCLDQDRQALWGALYRIRTHAIQAQAAPGFAKDQCWEIMQIAEEAMGGKRVALLGGQE